MQPREPRQLGGFGALGIVLAGALCAVVLSTTIRMPSDQGATGDIPGVVIGSSPGARDGPLIGSLGPSKRGRRAAVLSFGPRAAQRRRGTTDAGAHDGAPGEARPADRAADEPVRRTAADAPPATTSDPAPVVGRSAPAPRAPSGGGGGDDVRRAPRGGGEAPDDDVQEAPEPAAEHDPPEDPAPAAPQVSAPPAASEPDDDAAPTGLATPAPEGDSDEADSD